MICIACTPSWERYLSFCAAIFALGIVAVEFAPADSEVAAWWPAAGVAVSAMALHQRHRWSLAIAVVVCSSAANLVGGRPLDVALGFGLSNAAEGVIAAAWLNRDRRDRPTLASIGDVWRLVVATVFGAVTIATGAALTVVLFTDGDAVRTFRNIVPSHATAVLLITPFALSIAPSIPRRSIERVAVWGAATAAVVIVFWPGQSWPLAFVPISILIWTAFRFGLRETFAQLIVIGVLVTILTERGGGPFAVNAAQEALATSSTVMLIQLFIASNAVVLLPLAVALAEREAALDRVRASEVVYRAGFSEAIVGMLLVRLERGGVRVVEANGAAERMIGMRQQDLFSVDLRADDGRTLDAIVTGLVPGSGWRGEMSWRHHGLLWFNVAITMLSEPEARRIAAVQVVETTARHLVETELEQMALHDHLTGLPNRASLAVQLDDALDAAARNGQSLAVMYLDVDDFKKVNDASGHLAGDSVLIVLAERLQAIVRLGDVVARIGGDEFVLLCPDAGSPAVALLLAERIWAATERPIDIDGTQYEVSLSVGVALSTSGSTAEGLLTEADIALDAAKSAGKRRITLYSADLGDLAAGRIRVEAELRTAIRLRQFEMYMQPVVDVATGRISAAEALIRWKHPRDGTLAPAGWLDVAERAELMPELGAWVLDESVRQAASWIDLLGVDRAPAVHVNVSARQLDLPGFSKVVLDTIARHRLPPHQLVLELTETYLAHVSGSLVAELESLARLGIRIAADDYGTGYSPLTRIVDLPISIIKIDQQFVSPIAHDHRALGIVRSLVQLASTLDIELVAEGVETVVQADILTSLGCTTAQGYLWSPALPAAEFVQVLVEPAAATPRPSGDIRSMYLG